MFEKGMVAHPIIHGFVPVLKHINLNLRLEKQDDESEHTFNSVPKLTAST